MPKFKSVVKETEIKSMADLPLFKQLPWGYYILSVKKKGSMAFASIGPYITNEKSNDAFLLVDTVDGKPLQKNGKDDFIENATAWVTNQLSQGNQLLFKELAWEMKEPPAGSTGSGGMNKTVLIAGAAGVVLLFLLLGRK